MSGNYKQKRKQQTNNEGKSWLNIISLFFSIVAIIVSLLSYQVFRDAHALSLEQYNEGRLAIWTGEVDKNSEEIKLKSLDPQISLQSAAVHYPKTIDKGVWTIDAPNYTLPVTLLKSELVSLSPADSAQK